MSIHSSFVFPHGQFNLVFMSTIGYISDNVFYRLNLSTRQAEVQLNPKGRSYQAITTNHKHGLIVLADYGRNPNIAFDFLHKKQNSYQIKDVCQLEIDKLALSLDVRYLLVSCGIPENRILVIDVEARKVLRGEHSFVDHGDRKLLKLEFNPANNKIFAAMSEKQISVYQINQIFEYRDGALEEAIHISKRFTLRSESALQTFIWDEINNIYVSNGKNVFVYSTDTEREVISYDLEGDFDGQVIANLILTPKHLILVYQHGRIEWINKFYPDLLDEEEISRKPFYLDKYFEFSNPISYALYDHMFTKILVAHHNGFFSVLNKQAESNENEDEDEDNKGVSKVSHERNKKLEAEVTSVGPYHASHIILCREVKGKAIVMTLSTDGRIIFWSVPHRRPVAFAETTPNICAADVNDSFTILSVSDYNGCVQFYSIADFANVYLFKQFRLAQKGEINQIKFSSNGKQVACLSTANKRVFYILTDEAQEIEILGYVNVPYTPVSICWNKTTKTLVKPNFEHLLCCIGFGIVMVNGPAATSKKLRGNELELHCEMYALRTDLQQKLLQVLPTGEILSTGADKILKKYKQPDEPIAKFNPEAKVSIPPPLEELQSHDLETCFMQVNGRMFLSGGADGTLEIRSLDNFDSFKVLQVSGWKNANLFTGGLSEIDGLYYACGRDGSLSVWKTRDLQINFSDEANKEKASWSKIRSEGNNLKLFQVAIENEYLEKKKDEIIRKKKDKLDKITNIKTELRQLLAQNQTHEELQKLTRDQFVIDLESRDRIHKIGIQNCQRIKKQSVKNVLYNQVYRNKLKEITWDQMQQHLRAINGLKNNYLVYNYQIRKIGQTERRRLQLVLDLRRNQIRQAKKRGGKEVIDPDFYKNKNVINGGILQPLILTILDKKDEKKQEKGKKKKQEQVLQKQPEQVEQIPKEQVWSLLYSSFELFSTNAKKNQIIIMQNIIIKIKEQFNRQFNKLLKYRQSQNQIVNDKNKRIIEICDELKRPHEIIIGNRNILENPDNILEVTAKDIPFQRYLSRDEKEKLEKERLKEEERLRALAEDDSSQRALQKMMGGTLEEKKTSVLEVTVEREKWMDKPLEDMTEEEKAKLKEYETKKQKAEEEKERIVKKLEAELRKLKLQIEDVMDKYDQKLFNLLRRRIQYDLRIEEQELYCIKLSLSMLNFNDQSQKYKQVRNKLSFYETRIQKLEQYRNYLVEKQVQLEKAKQAKKVALDMKKLGESEAKIKTIEKSVFEQYNSNIKKRRELEEKLLEADEIAKYQIVHLDPFKQVESKILSNHNSQQFKFFLPEIKNLQQTYDFPDSLYNILENRFSNRKQEAEYDRKLKNVRDSVKNIEQVLKNQHKNLSEDKNELENIQEYLQKSRSDLEIQIRIKKGLVEIDSETPVPNLNDALLISKSEIDQKNATIIQKAGLKIDVMKQIKTCKISVTEQTLELERKQALIDEISSMIKEVQMLKVKKEMQTALSKKDTKINENELRSLKEQIEKVRKEGQKRINLFDKKIEKVNQEIQVIRKENKQLQVQKWNLQNTVKQRQKIKDMMVGENGEGNQEAAEKFDQISINRKLFDKAKQQTDEIQLLREQLSKLKAKTFANFSSVQR